MEGHQSNGMDSGGGGGVGSRGGGGTTNGSFPWRQSSSRWIPTADQIRILRELYYANGVRSPSAEQIQRITARLRRHGRIEGKNVFYWFQNHKARERQKRKLAPVDVGLSGTMMTTTNTTAVDCCCTNNCKPATACTTMQHHHLPSYGVASAPPPSSPEFYDVGQTGNNSSASAAAGGSMSIEKGFRECCLTGGDGSTVDNNNIGWVCELEPSVSWMYHCIEDEESATREIQILPLFPTRSQEQQEEQGQVQEGDHYGYVPSLSSYWNGSSQNQQQHHHHFNSNGAAAAAASVELTLNSYHYALPGSM